MAIWRDPLDELIAELERTLPAEANCVDFGLGPLEGLQLYVQALMYGSADQIAQAERDPRVQAYLAAMRRLGARSGA